MKRILHNGKYYIPEPHKIPDVGDMFQLKSGEITKSVSLSHLSELKEEGAILIVGQTKSSHVDGQILAMRYFPKFKDTMRSIFRSMALKDEVLTT